MIYLIHIDLNDVKCINQNMKITKCWTDCCMLCSTVWFYDSVCIMYVISIRTHFESAELSFQPMSARWGLANQIGWHWVSWIPARRDSGTIQFLFSSPFLHHFFSLNHLFFEPVDWFFSIKMLAKSDRRPQTEIKWRVAFVFLEKSAWSLQVCAMNKFRFPDASIIFNRTSTKLQHYGVSFKKKGHIPKLWSVFIQRKLLFNSMIWGISAPLL